MAKLKLRTKPYPHQKLATARAVAQGSHAFLFEPRCGKSKAGIDAMSVLHHRGEVSRVVVIAPLTVLSVWEDELKAHLSVAARVKPIGGATWAFGENPSLMIYLINYDRFSRRGEDAAYSNEWVTTIQKWRPDLIILDESHRCANAGAVRSQALWRMVERLRKKSKEQKPWVYLMTGTPGDYIKIFSQYRIMDQTIFGTSKQDFEDDYVQYGHGPKLKFKVMRYKRKGELMRKMKSRATIVTAQEAGLANKEFFNPIRITLPPRAKGVYDKLVNEFLVELEDGTVISAANAGVLRLRLLQTTGGFTTDGKVIHRAKVEAARDYLSDLCEQGENVVGYASYIPEVLALEQVAAKVGFDTRVIRGSVKRKDRTEYIQWFRRPGDKPKAFIFQSASGSLGLDLTSAAETFFFGLPDGWERFFQCINRVKGPKQKRPVRHTFLTARGTIDVTALEAMRNKRDVHKEMMGNPKGFLRGL